MRTEEIKAFFNELGIEGNYSDIIDNAIGALSLDPIAIKNLVMQIGQMPTLIKEAFYWNKFYLFVSGVKQIEEEFGQSVKLSNALFGNPKDRMNNGMRLLSYIDRADSEQKVEFYINATQSLLVGCIDITDYFRIMKAVSETLNEDLEYLAQIALNTSSLKGNIQLLALERSGLVIQAGIDANESIESQYYAVSSLGKMVDKYALSYKDEERWRLHKKEAVQHELEVDLPTATEEDIQKLFE